jgi:hypothetical protein
VSALKAIADNLGDGTSGVDKVMVYQDIIAAAADVATFPSVEVELRSTPAFTAFKPRRDFLKKWGAVDGVGLAGYFNTHPDQLSGDDVSSAMATITEKSPEKAFAMAQHFDSPAHFDRAVKFLMPYFYSRHPQEATELVQQLSSPADRNYYLNMIKNGLEDDINRD